MISAPVLPTGRGGRERPGLASAVIAGADNDPWRQFLAWGGDPYWADHAQFVQLVSAQATSAPQLVDSADTHFVFDQVSDVVQHLISDYHLI